MGWANKIIGWVSGNGAEVTAANNLQVVTPGFNAAGVEFAGGPSNGQAIFSEIDPGEIVGWRDVLSPEVDDDFRTRVAHDNLLDQEAFTDTAQNTGKHTHVFTTLTATMSNAGLLTNSGSSVATTVGMNFGTHRTFPVGGTQTIVCEISISFSALPVANVVVDFGLFLRGAANPFTPLDGVFFRLNSAGLHGVCSSNGTETVVGPFAKIEAAGAYTPNKVMRFLIQSNNARASFWVSETDGANGGRVRKFGEISTPVGLGYTSQARALPWAIRHANTGAAGGVLQCLVKDYRVLIRGPQYADRLSIVGSRVHGAYQGLSGTAMGGSSTYPNSTNPTAAAPSNTALTANLPAGLGGQGAVTAAAAAATDGIWGSYQNPAASVAVQGRTIVIRGVYLDAVNMGAAVATTATTIQFSLAFGHTAVSLATAESASFATATTKAPRRKALGFATWPIGSAIGASPQGGRIFVSFDDSPIFVNPGEFVQLVGKFLAGTATASQVINFVWEPLYGLE